MSIDTDVLMALGREIESGEVHLRLWNDGYDWVIAFDESDASLAWQEHTGDPREPDDDPWHEHITGGRFDLDDGRGLREMALSEILAHGRGFFASVNQ